MNGRGIIPQRNGERVAEHAEITKAEDEWEEGEEGKKVKSILLQVAELKITIADNLSKALDWSQIL